MGRGGNIGAAVAAYEPGQLPRAWGGRPSGLEIAVLMRVSRREEEIDYKDLDACFRRDELIDSFRFRRGRVAKAVDSLIAKGLLMYANPEDPEDVYALEPAEGQQRNAPLMVSKRGEATLARLT